MGVNPSFPLPPDEHTEAGVFPAASSALGGEGTILEAFLPPQVLPLIILFLLVGPIILLTGESLVFPLADWIQAHWMTSGVLMAETPLPPFFLVKLVGFILLSFLGGFQLMLRIKAAYYSTWASFFPRPHVLHVDYSRDADRGIIALLQWKLYQIAMIFLPPVLLAGLTAVVACVALYLFNTLGTLSFIGLSIQITLDLFLLLMLGMFVGIAALNSLWVALTTLFGDVIAITEPDLPNPIIMQRCGRIVFASPYIYVLMGAQAVLTLGLLGAVIWFLWQVDIQQFIRFEANYGLIFMGELAVLAAYLAFNFLKFYAYHHGLRVYYQKLPQQLKDCFNPPPVLRPRRAEETQRQSA